MRKTSTILVILVYVVCLSGRTIGQSVHRPIVFFDVTVIDVTGAPAKPNMSVIIVGDRIAEIGPARKIKTPKNAQVVHAKGKYLIPGLWDMHTHVEHLGEDGLRSFIAYGVTAIREMGGGDPSWVRSRRDKIDQGLLIGPRIKFSGPILESTRFIQVLERIENASYAGKRIGVGSEADVTSAIDSIKRLGVDFLKIRTNASAETYRAIAAEARRAGLPLVGHVPAGLSLIEVSDAGQKSVEHGLVLLNDHTDAEWQAIATRFVKNETYCVPTLIANRGFRHMLDKDVLAIIDDHKNLIEPRRKYVSDAMLEYWRKSMDMKKFESPPIDWGQVRLKNQNGFRLMHKAGVKMMAGTDIGATLVFPGSSLHEELELLVQQIGMTPMEALQSATRIPAEFFGLGDSLGTIEKDKLADLVLLDSDPLIAISNTRKIDAVMVRGKLFRKPELMKILASAANAVQK